MRWSAIRLALGKLLVEAAGGHEFVAKQERPLRPEEEVVNPVPVLAAPTIGAYPLDPSAGPCRAEREPSAPREPRRARFDGSQLAASALLSSRASSSALASICCEMCLLTALTFAATWSAMFAA